ncbi:MAG: hypothetical protein V3S81_00285 [Anaerolineales bacterium]|jgi:hypothetical protein|nr:hypothetical protein [Anaerolineales bacterium]
MYLFSANDGVPNFHFTRAITKMRLDELRKEAERERMLHQAHATRETLLDRLMISIGGYLVSAGEKLLERHIPVMPQCSKACPSDF